MDYITYLIEQNMERAITINQVLVENEETLCQIEKDQENIEEQNTRISKLLTSWQSYFHKMWNKLPPNIFKSNSHSVLSPNISSNVSSLQTEAQHLTYDSIAKLKTTDDRIKILQELGNQMSNVLDHQNQKLADINNNTKSNLINLEKNQIQIDNILT